MPRPRKGPRLGGSPSHQRKILSNLAASLIEHERVETTSAKAKVLRPYVEKMITKARRGDLHARRLVLAKIEDPEVVSEYVIVLESHVDADRVRESLARSGLLAMPSGDESRVQLRIVVEMVDGAGGYGAYAALREALLAVRGVRSALPVELERGRAILEVEAERDTRALLRELLGDLPPGLAVTPVLAGADSVTLRVKRTPVAPASGAIDTRTRKRY